MKNMSKENDWKLDLLKKIDDGLSQRPLSSLEQSRERYMKALELAHEKGDKAAIKSFQDCIELLDSLIDKKR